MARWAHARLLHEWRAAVYECSAARECCSRGVWRWRAHVCPAGFAASKFLLWQDADSLSPWVEGNRYVMQENAVIVVCVGGGHAIGATGSLVSLLVPTLDWSACTLSWWCRGCMRGVVASCSAPQLDPECMCWKLLFMRCSRVYGKVPVLTLTGPMWSSSALSTSESSPSSIPPSHFPLSSLLSLLMTIRATVPRNSWRRSLPGNLCA